MNMNGTMKPAAPTRTAAQPDFPQVGLGEACRGVYRERDRRRDRGQDREVEREHVRGRESGRRA